LCARERGRTFFVVRLPGEPVPASSPLPAKCRVDCIEADPEDGLRNGIKRLLVGL